MVDCSGHGILVNGTCICFAGFSGRDETSVWNDCQVSDAVITIIYAILTFTLGAFLARCLWVTHRLFEVAPKNGVENPLSIKVFHVLQLLFAMAGTIRVGSGLIFDYRSYDLHVAPLLLMAIAFSAWVSANWVPSVIWLSLLRRQSNDSFSSSSSTSSRGSPMGSWAQRCTDSEAFGTRLLVAIVVVTWLAVFSCLTLPFVSKHLYHLANVILVLVIESTQFLAACASLVVRCSMAFRLSSVRGPDPAQQTVNDTVEEMEPEMLGDPGAGPPKLDSAAIAALAALREKQERVLKVAWRKLQISTFAMMIVAGIGLVLLPCLLLFTSLQKRVYLIMSGLLEICTLYGFLQSFLFEPRTRSALKVQSTVRRHRRKVRRTDTVGSSPTQDLIPDQQDDSDHGSVEDLMDRNQLVNFTESPRSRGSDTERSEISFLLVYSRDSREHSRY